MSIFLLLAGAQICAQSASTPLGKPVDNAWSAPTRISVTTKSPELSAAETLTFDLFSSEDYLIVSSYPNQAARADARILVVAGRWMATKDVVLEKGFAIDALDGPMLTMKLVTRFLELAYPQGPSALGKRDTLEVTENFKPIRVNTMSAEGGWDAPWTLRGVLERKSPTQIIYDFVVLHSAPGDPNVHSIEFYGVWESVPNPQQMPDTMSLRGWKLYTLGTNRQKTAESVGPNFGAQEVEVSYATLGDLRGKTAQGQIRTQPSSSNPSIPASLSKPLQKY